MTDSGSPSIAESPSMLTEVDLETALDISAVATMDMSTTPESIPGLGQSGFASPYYNVSARATDVLNLTYDPNVFGPVAMNAVLESVPQA